jgi:hypothetical protein
MVPHLQPDVHLIMAAPINIIKTPGMLCLAIYLILAGLIGLFHISLGALSIVLPILALVAGILILIGK